MADKPIPCSAPMVRALLAGTKTQTRRRIKSARVFGTPEARAFTLRGADLARALQNASGFRRYDGNGWGWEADAFPWQAPAERTGWLAHIGHAPGDRLYVREHWRVEACFDDRSPAGLPIGDIVAVQYEADGSRRFWLYDHLPAGRFRQGMHMPRWASRITLTVTEVRVQRLHDISDEDALAEGIVAVEHRIGGITRYTGVGAKFGLAQHTPTLAYAHLWDTINGEDAWAENPWVAAYTFTVALDNIDGIGRAA